MRKLFALAALAVAAVAVMPAQAAHNTRTVSATITAPTAESGGAPVTRPARCAALLGLQNDVVGHFEALDAEEGDGGHTFTLTGTADFDIVFYANLGTCNNDPAPTSFPEFDAVGDEAGDIPAGAVGAIIVFKPAAPNQTFTFTID